MPRQAGACVMLLKEKHFIRFWLCAINKGFISNPAGEKWDICFLDFPSANPPYSQIPLQFWEAGTLQLFFISHTWALRVYLLGSVCWKCAHASSRESGPLTTRGIWNALQQWQKALVLSRSQRWYRLIHQSRGKCCARKPLKKRMGFSFRVLGLIKVQRKIDDHEEGSSSLHPAGESNTRVQHFNQAALAAVCPCLERLLIYMFLVRLAPLQMLSAVPWRKGRENLLLCPDPCLNLQLFKKKKKTWGKETPSCQQQTSSGCTSQICVVSFTTGEGVQL